LKGSSGYPSLKIAEPMEAVKYRLPAIAFVIGGYVPACAF